MSHNSGRLGFEELIDFGEEQRQLEDAFEDNDLEEFRLALEMGADPQICNSEGICVYDMALSTPGSVKFVDECLQYGCSPNYVNQRLDKAAINFAADSVDPAIFSSLLGHRSSVLVNYKFRNRTALHTLAQKANDENMDNVYQCIDNLICYGASVNIPDGAGLTLFQHLQQNSRLSDANKEVLKARIQRSVDSALKGLTIGQTPLMEPSNLMESQIDRLGPPKARRALIEVSTNIDTFLFFNTIRYRDNAAFDEIMAKDIDVNVVMYGETAYKCALSTGNCYALKRLLAKPELDTASVKCPLGQLVRHIVADEWNYRKCFFTLLGSPRIDINEADENGSTALHIAVQMRHAEAIGELLKRGAYIGAVNDDNIVAIDGICPDSLKKCFDNCISSDGNGSGRGRVSMSFDNLRCERRKYERQMPALSFIARSKDHRHLLEHPLITGFLNLKWQKLSFIFYINFVLYLLFALSIVSFLTLRFSGGASPATIGIFRAATWLGIAYMTIRELLQLLTLPHLYFRSATNYMEVVLIILSIACCLQGDPEGQTPKVLAVVTMLLIAMELFLLCGSLPVLSMSTHMLMLQAVAKSFLKSFLLYSIFVFTFSLCFYILFGSGNQGEDFNKFGNPLNAIVKTIVMLTGEFDAGDMEFTTLYTYLLFLLFVFLMSIVLYNLLNGLAVSDIQTIMGQAKQSGKACRIELLLRYEEVLVGWWSRYVKSCRPLPIEETLLTPYYPRLDRETVELALNILEQKQMVSKRMRRFRVTETRLVNIENKLAEVMLRLKNKELNGSC